jgi:serine/threonine protein kinase
MTQSLRACLADFGLATAKETQSMAVTPAANTKTAGTLRWQAPELLKDDDTCNSPASDIFAYACVCFEVCHE